MVFVDYIDDVDVVWDDVCCCYACGDCGDLLVLRKCMIVCVCVYAEWDVVFMMLFLLFVVLSLLLLLLLLVVVMFIWLMVIV